MYIMKKWVSFLMNGQQPEFKELYLIYSNSNFQFLIEIETQ